tara:strand:- start:1240 stop:2085 length:846 start_codon:yes stop_codon:yes gene_type:complete
MQLPAQLRRKPDSYKGSYGHILVLGGSGGLTGAVCLCSLAALKTGAGLVTAGVPSTLNEVFEIKLTEVMTLPLADQSGSLSIKAFKKIEENIDKFDIVVLGPGAGLALDTKKLILKIISRINKPLIIDADALTVISENLDILSKRKARDIILTPHLGEFSRLLGENTRVIKSKRKELVKKFALRYNLSLVLKGHKTIISDGKKLVENRTGNPGMATAGSGDVLAGIIAGLAAQGLSLFEAGKLGAYIHGLSADIAVKEKTQNCLLASDIIEYLPKAYKRLG